MFKKKIKQFREMREMREEYKLAGKNVSSILWYVTDTAYAKNRTANDDHCDKGCVFRNLEIYYDRYGCPEEVYELNQTYCKFFSWDKPCTKQDCYYQKIQTLVVLCKQEYEQAYENLKHARRRFWGLEK